MGKKNQPISQATGALRPRNFFWFRYRKCENRTPFPVTERGLRRSMFHQRHKTIFMSDPTESTSLATAWTPPTPEELSERPRARDR